MKFSIFMPNINACGVSNEFYRNCCVAVVGLIILFLGIGCQGESTSMNALRLEIDTRNSQPLRQALYGFNTNMINGDYGYLDDQFC